MLSIACWLQSCWWHCDVGDLKLETVLECWRQNSNFGDLFWMLVPDAQVKRMLVTKMAKTVTNIVILSPTHFVSNIRHQHRCSHMNNCLSIIILVKYLFFSSLTFVLGWTERKGFGRRRFWSGWTRFDQAPSTRSLSRDLKRLGRRCTEVDSDDLADVMDNLTLNQHNHYYDYDSDPYDSYYY